MKQLPCKGDTYVIKVDGYRKAYLYDYDLANLFFKALSSFEDAHVRLVNGYYKAVYVEEIRNANGFSYYGGSAQFIPALNYLTTCLNRHVKTGVVDVSNPTAYNLPNDLFKRLRIEKLLFQEVKINDH